MGRANFTLKMGPIISVHSARELPTDKADIAIIMGVYTRGRSRLTKRMAWGYITILFKGTSITVNGKMTCLMEGVKRNSKMVPTSKVTFFMGLSQASAITSVTQASTRANSQMETFMAAEFLHMSITDNTTANGKMDLFKVLDSLPGQMQTDIKVNISMDLNMVKEHSSLPMEKYLKENGKMAKSMDKVSSNLELKSSKDFGGTDNYRMLFSNDIYFFILIYIYSVSIRNLKTLF